MQSNSPFTMILMSLCVNIKVCPPDCFAVCICRYLFSVFLFFPLPQHEAQNQSTTGHSTVSRKLVRSSVYLKREEGLDNIAEKENKLNLN